MLGKYQCQGAIDILTNHKMLMFKTFLYNHRKATTQVAFVALKHYKASSHTEDRTDHRLEKRQTNLTFQEAESQIELLSALSSLGL